MTKGNITISGCLFAMNSAERGGATYFNAIRPTIADTIFTANSTTSHGGAIYIVSNAHPTIERCRFSGNHSTEDGSALYGDSRCTVNMYSTIITGNTHRDGAVTMKAAGGINTLQNVLFSGNYATRDGGALYQSYPYGTSHFDLINCTFDGNYAARNGGATYMANPTISMHILNSIVWNNQAATSGNAHYTHGNGTSLSIAYSDIQGGLAGPDLVAANSATITDAGGNINSNPLFAHSDTDTWTSDPLKNYNLCHTTFYNTNANWERYELQNMLLQPDTSNPRTYLIVANRENSITVWGLIDGTSSDTYQICDAHLKSKAGRWRKNTWVTDPLTSPCINAGDPTSDFSAEPNSTRINMGFYGNTPEASKFASQLQGTLIVVKGYLNNTTDPDPDPDPDPDQDSDPDPETDDLQLIWIEAEDSPRTSMTPDLKYLNNPNLSGNYWFRGNITEGLYAEYDITIPTNGKYELFTRRFWMHGAFRWRINSGTWYTVDEGQRLLDSTDVKGEPVSWISLGYSQLEAGTITLRVEMLTSDETDYRWSSVYGFDCFVLTDGVFTPNVLERNLTPRQPLVNYAELGKRLDRTMTILESATSTQKMPLNILFYGQSIVANSSISSDLPNYLKEIYPHADIHAKKLAIGGYEAPKLKRTAHYDLYPEYPDLVVFHVYGGEDDGSLEEIFANIKQYTTAEVITWTHHMDNFSQSRDVERDIASEFRRQLAPQYNYEIAEVREQWKDLLKTQHQLPNAYLVDQIHLNTAGSRLLADYLKPHFVKHPNPSLEWQDRVTTLDLTTPSPQIEYAPGTWTVGANGLVNTGTSPLKIYFTGNKVEAIRGSAGASAGQATITLDGQLPSTDKHSLVATRPTHAPGTWWPCINYIDIGENAIPQSYTVNFSNFNPESTTYNYQITGSVTGNEGTGDHSANFVATSGNISFSPSDIKFNANTPDFTATFEVRSMHLDTISGLANEHASKIDRYTIIQTRNNTEHTLEITPQSSGAICLKSLIIHSPQN